MTRLAMKLATALLGLLLLVQPAAAQTMVCANHQAMIEILQRNYREEVQAMGISGLGDLVEILVSRMGTWTILVTTPSGSSCIVSNGIEWQPLPLPPATET